ncbi:unnamed protein product [Chilo suppressalis]|uniref:Phosphodiesterase n=1 Tax=Chilo suppressalis TaxID=168631 RepID=A0ABN8L878_CHISP|nr:unnamed protein product [Chilo suppressalis]
MSSPAERTPENKSSRLLPPILSGDGRPLSGEHLNIVRLSPRVVERSPNMWKSRRQRGCFGGPSDSRGEDLQDIRNFLDRNRDFLQSYVVQSVSLEELEGWFFRKIKQNYTDSRLGHGRLTKLKEKVFPKSPFASLVKSLMDDLSEHTVIYELAKSITTAVGVDAYRIYKMYPDHPQFVLCYPTEFKKPVPPNTFMHLERVDQEQIFFPLDVAKKRCCVRISRHEDPLRFPPTPHDLLKAFKIKNAKDANYILYQPILNGSGKTGYVIEMWRVKDRFKERDEEVSSNYTVWGSLALHFSLMYIDKKRERDMTDFLLDVVKAIFEEMVSLDQLIKRILEFAQRLVNADRASLFLVDYINHELVSTVFDLKFDNEHISDVEKKEIRMPINRGIAGHVATSGETMNIPDAYLDVRFNREVDEATGYKTINILCMPIKVEGKIIGVVQMVNKRDNISFTHEDEVSFENFSTFFGLALHNAKLYDRIMRKEQKYRVALEVLSYHNTCKENDVEALLKDGVDISTELNDFRLDPYKLDEFEKCKSVIKMFDDLFKMSNFDMSVLTRFVLTVKKNYRTVPYHNFDHGWSVAQAMYVILKNDYGERFDYKRRLALFVASLCHDLDHRGYTNKYMSETASPLAAMYTTSTLEHHHFNITVTILQQDGHNIFAHLSSEEYKEVLGFIRQAILATDLAAFFPNLEKIKGLHDDHSEPKFDWHTPKHKDLAMAISMTAADLSASAKPWKVQLKTVKVIFEEFYAQGDKEKAIGKTPIPMMDRNKPEEQPASQVGFLSQICIPCYTMLFRILPYTMPMYQMAKRNLDKWNDRARKVHQLKQNNGNQSKIEIIVTSDQDSDEDKDICCTIETIAIVEPKKEAVAEVEEGKANIEMDDGSKYGAIKKHKKKYKKSLSVEEILWEEEEQPIPEAIVNRKLTSGGFWEEGESSTSWIDEEGVVIQTKALKSIPRH